MNPRTNTQVDLSFGGRRRLFLAGSAFDESNQQLSGKSLLRPRPGKIEKFSSGLPQWQHLLFIILASHGHDKERLVATSSTPQLGVRTARALRPISPHQGPLVILQAAHSRCHGQPIICRSVSQDTCSTPSLATLEEPPPLGQAGVWPVVAAEPSA